MRKVGLALLLTSLLLGYGSAALARGAGGGHTGGMAPGHMSPEGKENTNAQWSPGAVKGQERAEERRSEEGAEHEKAKAGSQDTDKDQVKQRVQAKKRGAQEKAQKVPEGTKKERR